MAYPSIPRRFLPPFLTALSFALLTGLVLTLLSGCLPGRGPRGVTGEPLTEEWYQARHQRVLGEFYGFQDRVEQYRLELEEERQRIASEWWAQERLRQEKMRREEQKQALQRQVMAASLRRSRVPTLPLP